MAQKSVMSLLVLLLTALIISFRPAGASQNDRSYKVGDYIPLFANKVYPLKNPCDALSYFDLPFCPPGSLITNRKKSYDELIEGDCFTNTLYDLKFKVDKIEETLCEKHLTKDEVAIFRYAIRKNVRFQMYYNNIPLWDAIGKVEANAGRTVHSRLKYYYLIKNISFYPYYIGNQVRNILVKSDFDNAVDITEDVGIKVNFTYSVFWKKLEVNSVNTFFYKEGLLGKYGWRQMEPQGCWDISSFIYWACIIFSWILLLLVATVLYLSNYITRYSINGDLEEAREQINLKQIHGDACGCPPYSSLLGAILGIGTQLLVLICFLFILAYKEVLFPCNHLALNTYILLSYCLTSVVSGYVATSFHSQYTTVGWKECIFQTGMLYFVPVYLTVLAINKLLYFTYGLSELPDFSAGVLVILLIWGLGTISFLRMGGKIGYASRSNPQAFCTTSRTPRENIAQPSWYMKTPAQMFLGGLLPFMTIFWEMDNIYASLWKLKVCGAFKTVLMAFIVVITLTIILGICFTYFQLSKQDYQWWWRSVLRGGSTAIFMFAYGFYFFGRTDPQEFMKLLLFMGYNACIFYAFFLILGTIGFYASLLVFRCMYQRVQKYE